MVPHAKSSLVQTQELLIDVIHDEYCGDRQACLLFEQLLECASYSRQFAMLLIDVARGNQRDTWAVRRLATLMLQLHLLLLDANDSLEFDLILRGLGLKKSGPKQGKVIKSVLKEGYSTRDFHEFVREFRRKLKRPRGVVEGFRKRHATVEDVRRLAHLSRLDCKLALGRYLFSPDEVVERIRAQVDVRNGLPLALDGGQVQDEMLRAVGDLPDYEAAILKELLPGPVVFWVRDDTPSNVNSLVEYPLGTVVLVVKPPGSEYEFEFKRAGRRGDHPLSARSHVPSSHRLDGGSMVSALQYEAAHVAAFGRLYRQVHGEPAPVSRVVNLVAKHSVPLRNGDSAILDYFNDRSVYGEGFEEMRKAMSIVVECFRDERGDQVGTLPGDFGLTAQFVAFTGPAQAVICGSCSLRLDLLAKYLGPDGPDQYFMQGLQVQHTAHDGKLFADDLLDEVLGSYHPPQVKYESHQQYVDAALAVPKNRSRANAVYLDLHEQIGMMSGTLMGARGYSFGESFVARNVGLRTVWNGGKWRVRLVFQDHDNLVLPEREQEEYWPLTALAPTYTDARYIGTVPEHESLTRELDCLRHIYRADEPLRQKGLNRLRKTMKRAYVKTQEALKDNPEVRSQFNERFIDRLGDWDAVARKYLARNGAPNADVWKDRVRKYLMARGYDERSIEQHCNALERYGTIVEEFSHLYRAKVKKN